VQPARPASSSGPVSCSLRLDHQSSARRRAAKERSRRPVLHAMPRSSEVTCSRPRDSEPKLASGLRAATPTPHQLRRLRKSNHLKGMHAPARDNASCLLVPGQWDDETWAEASSGAGLFYNVHRWIEPGTGRYTRVDAIGLLGSMNPYNYAWSSPTRWSDPLGLSPKPLPPERTRNRPCNPEESRLCQDICGSFGVQSCFVAQTFRLVRAKEGVELWKWKDGPFSCSCNEPPTDNFFEFCLRKLRDVTDWMVDNPPRMPVLPLPGPSPFPPPLLPLPIP
jgi:RHS repeat-associated protein